MPAKPGGYGGREPPKEPHPTLTPTLYQYNHENLFFRDTEIIDFWGLDGPGGARNHSRRRGASHPTFWSGLWGPRGRPDPQNR